VEAELTRIDGRRLWFNFIAYAPDEGDDVVIGAGSVERMLVDTERFLAKLQRGS
jgi:predicted thioesterase